MALEEDILGIRRKGQQDTVVALAEDSSHTAAAAAWDPKAVVPGEAVSSWSAAVEDSRSSSWVTVRSRPQGADRAEEDMTWRYHHTESTDLE